MHPLIRILCLLILAALMPWLPGEALLALALSLLAWGLVQPVAGRAMIHGARRVRWLLLSLLVLYLWFTPGPPLVPSLGAWSPGIAGTALALWHGGVLLVMTCTATALLGGLPPHQLTAALRSLLARPAVALRFADRAGLLLAGLPAVEQRVRASLREGGGFAERAASLVRHVEADACAGIEVDEARIALPPPMQWLLPITLAVVGIATVAGFGSGS